MIDPRTRITPQPDVVERTMIEALARDGPIFRLVRVVKRGPLCPAYLGWVQTRFEPGEPSNTMERSPFIVAYLSGEPTEPARLFATGKAGSSHITRAEYARLVAEIASNRRHGRYDPRAFPNRPVDVGQMPLPFQKAS